MDPNLVLAAACAALALFAPVVALRSVAAARAWWRETTDVKALRSAIWTAIPAEMNAFGASVARASRLPLRKVEPRCRELAEDLVARQAAAIVPVLLRRLAAPVAIAFAVGVYVGGLWVLTFLAAVAWVGAAG